MKSTEQISLDVHKRIPLLRDSAESNSVESGATPLPTTLQRQLSVPAPTKKALNIPIGDVTLDPDYNKDISPTFRLPAVYVKYIKKIGDEADISLDYVIDSEDEVWIKSLGGQGVPKDMQKLMTVDAFETIFNILERYTGLSKDPIPQVNATRVVQEELQWSDAAVAKLLPLAYAYWLSRRVQLGKPLCRKYWPQVTSSDTNPRQVFRARDKERYKLRKQQKRNDIDAYRKMQQLRKEFATAKNLLSLVLERELLREAEFDSQRELFERRAWEEGVPYSCPGAGRRMSVTSSTMEDAAGSPRSSGEAANAQRTAAPYRHALRFEDLVYPPQERMMRESEENAAKIVKDGAEGGEDGADGGAGRKLTEKKRRRERDREAQLTAAAEAVEAPLVVFSYDNNGNLIPGTAAPQAPARPVGRGAGRGGAGRTTVNPIAAATFDPTLSSAEIYTALLAEHQLAEEPPAPVGELRVIAAGLEGPSTICQPRWPSFMDVPRNPEPRFSWSNYMADLEYRTDEKDGAYIAPLRYKARCRIGRGGRLVMDRIPVYDADDEEGVEGGACPSAQGAAVHVYPTSLPYQYTENAYSLHFPGRQPGAGAGPDPPSAQLPQPVAVKEEAPGAAGPQTTQPLPELGLSNGRFYFTALKTRTALPGQVAQAASVQDGALGGVCSYNAPMTIQQRLRLARIPKIPAFAPPGGVAIPPYKAARIASILAASDSEDEKVHIPKYRKGEEFERTVNLKATATDPIKVKYSTSLR